MTMADTSPQASGLDAATDSGFCRAVSQHGQPVNIYGLRPLPVLVIARPGRDFVCTQDQGHDGGHAACDGNGRILAKWPRSAEERYWQRSDCDGHG